MRNVLFVKGESQYDAMRYYIDEIEVGFRLAGFHTIILDALEQSFGLQLAELAEIVSIDIIFGCNAILGEVLKGEKFLNSWKITYLCDHPSHLRDRLLLVDEKTIVFVCDELYERYLKKYYPDIKYSCFIPLAGSCSQQYMPFSQRTIEMVFTGSYYKPENLYQSALQGMDGALKSFAEFMLKDIIANPDQTIDECLCHALEMEGITVSENEFDELVCAFYPIDVYARFYYRDKVIRILIENGMPVHVYGNGWEDFESDSIQNLIIEKGNSYTARKAIAKAKISLNVMPWFKAGFQERIATAMLSGTVAVTDESSYIKENFENGKELITYSLRNLRELPQKISGLLRRDDLGKIADAGKKRADNELTWQHRTFEMLDYIMKYVDPGMTLNTGSSGSIIGIVYQKQHMNHRLVGKDAIAGIKRIFEMLSDLQAYDTVDIYDLKYFYSQFLLLFFKIHCNFPEIHINEYIDNYMTALTEENILVGIELLVSECSDLQSVFLQAECEFLTKENNRLKQEAISIAEQPSGFDQKVLYQKLLQNYGSSTEPEMKETLENIKKQGFAWSYNQNFVKKYNETGTDAIENVYYDEEAEMHFVYWNGKRMYYPKSYSKENIAVHLNFANLEQDLESPHRYIDGNFDVYQGDIVIDAGVAEGNFALDVVEKAKKLYLVECDPIWLEALRRTFKPWEDKVVIVEKMLGNQDDETHITVNSLVLEDEVNFIKMDVEGAEMESLYGAADKLDQSKSVRCAICCYHRKDAEEEIQDFFRQKGFFTMVTKGYMFFRDDLASWVDGQLRHGIVRAVKI